MFVSRKKIAAGLGAVVVAGTAGLVAVAPAASAGTVTPTATCVVPVVGTKVGPQDIKVDLTPVTGPTGTVVTANVDLGPPPITSPFAFDSAKAQSTLHLAMSGAATGTVDLAGPEVTLPIPKDVPIDPAPFTTTFTIPAGASLGAINFTPTGSTNSTDIPGFGKQVAECTYAGGGVVASFTVKAPVPQPTLTATPPGKQPGQAIDLNGTKWTEPGPYKVELCDAGGNACDVAGFSANTVAADGSGVLTGTATLAASATPGAHQVKVSNSGQSASAAYTVAGIPPRTGNISPASGKAGTVVTATGSNFAPNASVAIAGVAGAGQSTDAPTIVQTDANGSFSGTITVNDPNTTGIAMAEVADQTKVVLKSFLFIKDNEVTLNQNASGDIKPGVLNMTQTTPGITLSEITLNGTAQTMNGKLNQVAVVDFRGSTLG
ncbi:hypothetical protein, partial [Yinghuangia seranimata]|uniref:hypothetical protein n=1 Tax=Yinghuangia seranimata TaxID=408067 RepID=UPI00248B7F91